MIRITFLGTAAARPTVGRNVSALAVQREGEVMHLVASRLVDHTPLLQGLESRSRDFR